MFLVQTGEKPKNVLFFGMFQARLEVKSSAKLNTEIFLQFFISDIYVSKKSSKYDKRRHILVNSCSCRSCVKLGEKSIIVILELLTNIS